MAPPKQSPSQQACGCELAERVSSTDVERAAQPARAGLQQELHEKVASANRTIQAPQAEMQEKVGETNRLMHETISQHDQTTNILEEQIERMRRESERTLGE